MDYMLDKYSVTRANMAHEYISKVSKSCLRLLTLSMRLSSAKDISKNPKILKKKSKVKFFIVIFGFSVKMRSSEGKQALN